MRVKQPLPIGTAIKLRKQNEDSEEEGMFRVVEIYEHFVVCKNNIGIRQAVTNAELYTRGLVEPYFDVPRPDLTRHGSGAKRTR